MKKMKVIDLFNVRYDEMGDFINKDLIALQEAGHEIIDVKVIGEKLGKCAVFVFYKEA